MAETLYEQIKDHEEKLNLNPEGDDNATDDDKLDEGEGKRSVRGQDGHDSRERPEQGEGEGAGTRGRGRPRKDAPRDKSGASPEDARARDGSARASQETGGSAQKEGDGTQEDAPPSPEDGETVLEEEKPLTNADWARQRKENRELRAKIAQLEAAKTAPQPAPPPPAPAPAPPNKEAAKEPDKNVNYQEWLEWKLAQSDNTIQEQNKLYKELSDWKNGQEARTKEQETWNNDATAFVEIENRYKATNPDYGNAADYARDKYFNALKISMPQATDAQINAAINNEVMGYARMWRSQGLNPAEEFYDMAIERFGYEKADEEAVATPPMRRTPEKPNLRVVNNNRKRSATPLNGGGQGGSVPLTKEAAADMTIGEWNKLTPSEIEALENMA